MIRRELSIEYPAFESDLVETGLYEIGTELEIEILGELYIMTVVGESPYDPSNEK